MRALRPCMVMTLMPSGPGTSICWSCDSGTSRKILPPLRMIALSARPPFHKLRASSTTLALPSNSVSQSPDLRCGRMAARTNSCEFTMAHQHLLLSFKMPRKLLGEIHRAMLPTGAADGHGEIAAVVGNIAGKPAFQKITDIAKHVLRGRCVFQKFDARSVVSGERAQRQIVVGIGQAAHIEYQVRVQRNAMFETE